VTLSPDKDDRSRLKVTFRRIRSEDAGLTRVLSVFCPRREHPVDVRECRGCEHCRGLCIDATDRETFLRCVWPDDAPPDATRVVIEGGGRPLPESAEPPARQTKLAAIMKTPVHSVTPETSVASLIHLFFEQGISAAPVVDANGKAIGIVSKTDLLERYIDEQELESSMLVRTTPDGLELDIAPKIDLKPGTVADIMTHLVYTLAAEASISRAAALMSYEGVHRIVVAAGDGKALGIVSALDILRWIARSDGYVVPELTRVQTDRHHEGSE
jgi:CBS domain-containing protein